MDHGAMSLRWDPLMGSWRNVKDVGHAGGTMVPHHEHGTHWWHANPSSSRWYTGQTIYDDLVSLFSDVVSIFVTILRAKAPSLIKHDEATNFVIE